MDNPLLYKLVEEFRFLARLSLQAWKFLPEAIQQNDPDKAVFFVEALLDQAARAADLLWPRDTAETDRGERLRDALKIPPDSPLQLGVWREKRRNYDENLLEWARQSEHRNFVGVNLMPVGTLEGFPADQFHRSLDPEAWRYSFEGVSVEVRLVVKALQRAEDSAQYWLRSHHPW